jgi:glycosyltransferase involved in cell wall biosynthesis
MKASIITIVRNGADVIERTIESVLAQTYRDIEYIIIDGASTDNTNEVIKKYACKVAIHVSEPDNGISDAWNKGLNIASGDVIGLLNAGDEYLPETVEVAVQHLAKSPGVVYGDTQLVSESGQVTRHTKGRFHPWKYSGGIGFYHPSCFASSKVYRECGTFNPKLRYAMDIEWILKARKYGYPPIHNSDLIVKMLDDGVSVQNRFKAYGEYLDTLMNHESRAAPYLSMLSTGIRGLARIATGR